MASAKSSGACFSCTEKKRGCDRLLPACSTCSRLHRRCYYETLSKDKQRICGVPAFPHESPTSLAWSVQLVPLDDSSKPNTKAWKACFNCKKYKKLCTKTLPSCERCSRWKLLCEYKGLGGIFDQSLPERPESLSVYRVGTSPPCPIASRSDIPTLIRFYQYQWALAPLPVDANSLAYHFQTAWLRYAFSDPCLFSATLWCSAAQFDASKGDAQSYTTLYYQNRTLKLLRRKLAISTTETLKDATIAVVAALFFHASLEKEIQSVEFHKRALIHMIYARGGFEKLGFDGLLADLVYTNLTLSAVMFDTQPGFPIMTAVGLSPLMTLVSLIVKRLKACNPAYNISAEVINIFEEIHRVLATLVTVKYNATGEEHATTTLRKWRQRIPEVACYETGKGDPIYRSCWAAAEIFWYLSDTGSAGSELTLQRYVEDLKTAIAPSRESWKIFAPELNLFVCVVGAAAAEDVDDRTYFIANEWQFARAVRYRDISVTAEFWACYQWLKQLRNSKGRGEDAGVKCS